MLKWSAWFYYSDLSHITDLGIEWTVIKWQAWQKKSVVWELVLRSKLLDFNIPYVDWKQTWPFRFTVPSKVSKTFLHITANKSFEQLVDFLTWKDKILDLILTCHPSYKHLKLKWIWSISWRPRQIIKIWKKCGLISRIPQTKRVPTKMTSARYSHRWMNGSIKHAIRGKQRAHRKSKRTNTKWDRDRYKRLQQQVQWEIRRADRQYMQDYKNLSWARVADRKICPRVTVWHHTALPNDAKQWSQGMNFSICTKQLWFFFLHTLCSPAFNFNVGVAINELHSYMLTSPILKGDVVCDIAMTSTPNVLTTELCDLLYNQCIDNKCCY